ncbi:MAG: hypothetical protein LBR85_07780, partial [Oscillospiraceae bacterium]|jgi:hypothetical protein|nr:hypothetical protein [Oscillospiraceae bacterium]
VLGEVFARISRFEYADGSPGGTETLVTIVGEDAGRARVELLVKPAIESLDREGPVILGSCGFAVRERARDIGVSSGRLLWADAFSERNQGIPLADILEMPIGELVDAAGGGP